MPSWIKGSFSVIHWNYVKRDNKSRTLKLPIPYNNLSASKLEDDTVKLTTSFQFLVSSHICEHCDQIHTSACSRGIEAGVLPSSCWATPNHLTADQQLLYPHEWRWRTGLHTSTALLLRGSSPGILNLVLIRCLPSSKAGELPALWRSRILLLEKEAKPGLPEKSHRFYIDKTTLL